MTSEGVAGAVSGEHGAGWSVLALPAAWDELILPDVSRDLLRSISGDVRFRRREGENGHPELRPSPRRLMFAGERDTGKLLAARVLASDLGLALVRVELATLLRGPRAANEERLSAVFGVPERLGAIVYLDDAGTWFGERTAGPGQRDAGADPDQAALLARVDAHHGLVIFAANLGIASAAVIERLDHTVEFPFPDERGRRRIWAIHIPAGAALDDRALDFLAGPFQLTGGAIRRCCISARSAAAAEGARVELRHLVAAVENEYRGRVQGARAREALERFHGRAWSAATAPRPPGPAQRLAPDPRVVPDTRVPRDPRIARDTRVAPALATVRSRRVGPGRVHLALAVAAALAAAIVGFLIAHRSASPPTGPPALAKPFSAGVLSVDAPATWQQGASSVSGLQDELSISPSRGAGTIVFGRTTVAPTTLPATLLAELPHAPGPAVVTLAGTLFYRYLGLQPRDGSGPVSVYVLPTTVGTVVAECLGHGAGVGFASTCERVVSTLRLSSGTALVIGPNASYAAGLDRAMAVLTKRVADAAGRLHAARTPQGQARAANGAAAAYQSALTAVNALAPGMASADNQAVASALRSIAGGFQSLRTAALRNDAAGFAAAERTIASGQSSLQAAIAQLAKLGYSVS